MPGTAPPLGEPIGDPPDPEEHSDLRQEPGLCNGEPVILILNSVGELVQTFCAPKPIKSDDPEDANYRWEEGTPTQVKLEDTQRLSVNTRRNASLASLHDVDLATRLNRLVDELDAHTKRFSAAVDATVSRALGRPIITICLARPREAHRSTRRATTTSSAGKRSDSSDQPARPRALGSNPQRLTRAEAHTRMAAA